MSDDSRPPTEVGGRLQTAPGLYAGAYALAFVGTTLAIIKLFQWLGYVAAIEPCCASVLAVLPAFWVAGSLEFIKPLRRRWQRSLVRSGAPMWYAPVVGATAGSVSGWFFSGAFALSDSPLVFGAAVFVALAGPIAAVWWIVRPKRRVKRPEAVDYDDRMTFDSQTHGTGIDLPDLAATESFGRRLGERLFPNAVVALVGPLGAGKTHLSRAIAEGLGIANPAAVTSPTFTLIHEYPARLPVFHFDAYRLNGPNEFLDLGVTEYYEAGGVCLIEWADKVEAALPAERLTIRLVPLDENRRRAEVVGVGEKYEALAAELASGVA